MIPTVFTGLTLAMTVASPAGPGTVLVGSSMAMQAAGTPIRGSGWVCVQCCVMAAGAPAAMLLALAALLTAARRSV